MYKSQLEGMIHLSAQPLLQRYIENSYGVRKQLPLARVDLCEKLSFFNFAREIKKHP